MVNYGRISMESKKGSRFDISSEPRLIFVPSKGNILVPPINIFLFLLIPKYILIYYQRIVGL